ncbi:hypothetical protein SNEBB_005096 [Seison nebaliae]|nr:hypothetical protein SNEBB_005096 [Seison nebaliae]
MSYNVFEYRESKRNNQIDKNTIWYKKKGDLTYSQKYDLFEESERELIRISSFNQNWEIFAHLFGKLTDYVDEFSDEILSYHKWKRKRNFNSYATSHISSVYGRDGRTSLKMDNRNLLPTTSQTDKFFIEINGELIYKGHPEITKTLYSNSMSSYLKYYDNKSYDEITDNVLNINNCFRSSDDFHKLRSVSTPFLSKVQMNHPNDFTLNNYSRNLMNFQSPDELRKGGIRGFSNFSTNKNSFKLDCQKLYTANDLPQRNNLQKNDNISTENKMREKTLNTFKRRKIINYFQYEEPKSFQTRKLKKQRKNISLHSYLPIKETVKNNSVNYDNDLISREISFLIEPPDVKNSTSLQIIPCNEKNSDSESIPNPPLMEETRSNNVSQNNTRIIRNEYIPNRTRKDLDNLKSTTDIFSSFISEKKEEIIEEDYEERKISKQKQPTKDEKSPVESDNETALIQDDVNNIDWLLKNCIFKDANDVRVLNGQYDRISKGNKLISLERTLSALKKFYAMSNSDMDYLLRILRIMNITKRTSETFRDIFQISFEDSSKNKNEGELEKNYEKNISRRLFHIIAALARRIPWLNEEMGLFSILNVLPAFDLKSLEMKTFELRQLWEYLIMRNGCDGTTTLSIDDILVDLKAGGIDEGRMREAGRKLKVINKNDMNFDFLDFLTYSPLFIYLHFRIINNPFIH